MLILAFPLLQFASDSLSFISPVKHEVKLSGNFMELRTNHFHTGIDIKSSQGKVGDPIYSVERGYVSRIKVQSGSYGQVLYINHPNNLTTVYAHLDEFNPEIDAWVKSMQYKLESYELDVYLSDSLFVLNKGDQLGNMGNTGRSFGPHLHFEIRETDSEKPLNPELFGFAPKDHVHPEFQNLHIYYMDSLGIIEDTEIKYFRKAGNQYELYTEEILFNSDAIAFGTQCFDRIDGSYNKNGINAYKIYIDGKLELDWKAEDYSFDESRKINGFIDYNRKRNYNQTVYRLFTPQCSRLNYFSSNATGIIKPADQQSHNVKIVISDSQENDAVLEFRIRKSKGLTEINEPLQTCDSLHSYKLGMFELNFKKNSFFDHRPKLNLKKGQEKIMGQLCHKLTIGNVAVPLNKYFSISCPVPPNDPSKYTFITRDNKGRWVHFGAMQKADKLTSQLDQLGDIYLFKDEISPTVQLINEGIYPDVPLVIKIEDNLIPDGHVPDLYYRATVNGKWVRLIYDLKSNTLTFKDYDKLDVQRKVQHFHLEVSDSQGNLTEWFMDLNTFAGK